MIRFVVSPKIGRCASCGRYVRLMPNNCYWCLGCGRSGFKVGVL